MRNGVIAAISTPPGKGGVALIRMSGEGAFDIIAPIFQPKSKKALGDYPPRTQIYGNIIYNNEVIDDGMVTLFPAPHSYTGEDTVEISCHGGRLVTELVLEALFVGGARAAEAGEFTRRAFVGGRLSLTAAEAIGNLLEAESREQLKLSSKPARDRLGKELDAIRDEITAVLSSIFARIDYPDEDLGELTDDETVTALSRIRDRLSRLGASYRTGRAIVEGVRTVICGKPNAGKSSIYNLLVGEDAAIVTDIAGTTRDVLERSVPLGRAMLRLCDTAGIREGVDIDAVERIGIDRSRDMIERAELILAVFDMSRPLDGIDSDVINAVREASGVKIALLNKSDTPGADALSLPEGIFESILTVSARDDSLGCREQISREVDRLFTDDKIRTAHDPIISSARQHSSLLVAERAINSAIDAIGQGMPIDAAASDIERSLGAIGELDGRGVSESVTADIFAKFCVGK